MWTVGDIARRVGARLEGDGSIVIAGCAGLDEATESDLSFLADARKIDQARKSRAGAIILPEDAEPLDRPVLRVANPRLAFARALALFARDPGWPEGRHPTSVIDPTARLGKEVGIGPYVVVGAGAVIGDRVRICAGVYVGPDAVVGDDTVIYPNAVVREGVRIGKRCIIHAGAVIGSDGFGYVLVDGRHERIPQIGTVEIGDDVEIGALTAIDRATCGVTRIGSGTKVDNLVQIGHNVQIGERCIVVAQSGIAGSSRLGRHVTIAAQVGVSDHVEVGDGTIVAARGGVIGNIPANSFVSGFPARPHSEQMRIAAALQRLPELVRAVRRLEARVRELEGLQPADEWDRS